MVRRVLLMAGIATLVTSVLVTGSALAAKGGNGNGHSGASNSAPSSITLNESAPHLGGQVTFSVTYPGNIKNPRIAVRCYFADGTMGYAEAGPYDQAFVLGGGSSDWLRLGGPASCTAELFYIIWNGNNPQEFVSLAMTSFDAAG